MSKVSDDDRARQDFANRVLTAIVSFDNAILAAIKDRLDYLDLLAAEFKTAGRLEQAELVRKTYGDMQAALGEFRGAIDLGALLGWAKAHAPDESDSPLTEE